MPSPTLLRENTLCSSVVLHELHNPRRIDICTLDDYFLHSQPERRGGGTKTLPMTCSVISPFSFLPRTILFPLSPGERDKVLRRNRPPLFGFSPHFFLFFHELLCVCQRGRVSWKEAGGSSKYFLFLPTVGTRIHLLLTFFFALHQPPSSSSSLPLLQHLPSPTPGGATV